MQLPEESATRKRGRPVGATSWWRKPVNVAAHHANVLLELWLADAPIHAVRSLLSSLAGNPEYQELIEKCWRERGDRRRFTVPKPIKVKLCKLAIAHVTSLYPRPQAAAPQVESGFHHSKVATAHVSDRDWSDSQIGGRFIPQEHGVKPPKPADVKKVVNIVSRRAPAAATLRRKASSRKLRREKR